MQICCVISRPAFTIEVDGDLLQLEAHSHKHEEKNEEIMLSFQDRQDTAGPKGVEAKYLWVGNCQR